MEETIKLSADNLGELMAAPQNAFNVMGFCHIAQEQGASKTSANHLDMS